MDDEELAWLEDHDRELLAADALFKEDRARPEAALKMTIRRIPSSSFDKGPLAGIPTTVWTKRGLPIIQQEDDLLAEGRAMLSPSKDDGGALEPLPDRMLAIHWRTEELWIGIGDGYAIPLPATMPIEPKRPMRVFLHEELITKALYSLDSKIDKEGAVEWCRPAAQIVTMAILQELGLLPPA